MMRILSALIFILSAASIQTAPSPYRLTVLYPDDKVLPLGATFSLVLKLDLDRPFILDRESLPTASRVDLHLRRGEIEIQQGWRWSTRRYTLNVPYQVIGQSSGRAFVTVSALIFQLKNGDRVYPLVVEPFSVDIAAGVDLGAREAGQSLALSEPSSVPLLDTRYWLTVFSFSVVLLLAVGGFLIWRAFARPWWQRYNQPFARANRALRRLPDSAESALRLHILHVALDSTARETVLSCDVARFVQRFPQYAECTDAIEKFFAVSDAHYFSVSTPDVNCCDLQALLARCARLESAR